MKRIYLLMALLAFSATIGAQARYDYDRLSTERLNRGVVAVKNNEQKVCISWRTLRSDKKGEPFDIYRYTVEEHQQGRDGVKLNAEPLTTGGTFFIDENPLETDAVYEVRGGTCNGTFTLCANAPKNYLSLQISKPEGGITPDGRRYTYSANDASVGDVDGDGQYEIILKWDPSNAHDNAHAGFTGPTIFDCYKINDQSSNSTLLWRINLGPNIRSGAHYTQFIVYDFDGDGRAEMMCKTADGTRDGIGTVIGDSLADYRYGAKEALAHQEERRAQIEQEQKEMEEWRRQWEQARQNGQQPPRWDRNRRRGRQDINPLEGRILEGPEYLTVFDGLTGKALCTVDYIPERGDVRAWGDRNANRSDRFLAAVGYFGASLSSSEGSTTGSVSTTTEDPSGAVRGTLLPSAVFCRGYYTRSVIAAWDWDGHELKERWTFDTNPTSKEGKAEAKWASYAGQGNHNLRVADVDGDGFDEITYGSMAINHDGRGLYNTGMGHGDAIHLIADPKDNALYIWDCHENKRDGSDLRNAHTGEVIFQIKSKEDVGRAMAADIDPTNPGCEMWSTDSHGVRNMKGEEVCQANDPNDPQHNNHLIMNGRWLSVNFGIWWDGDLLRELLDRQTVTKYNWVEKSVDVVQSLDGQFNNGTKSNPCLQADILGDWREEVIMRNAESTELRIYTTTIPTPYRIDCLMHDIPYRLSVATENVGYNQPPEAGYYIGPDRTDYLK